MGADLNKLGFEEPVTLRMACPTEILWCVGKMAIFIRAIIVPFVTLSAFVYADQADDHQADNVKSAHSTMSEVYQVAIDFAESLNIDTSGYSKQICLRPYRNEWSVAFDNEAAKWADYFTIIVDDQSHETRIIRGH
ncbi:hypothetical protein IC757_11090 [Wenzhouxiangella sp. AB-CW3]|nr:hypothetical protein IC757_11090 [Wenzhouxiangella sp. AB-CW3]